MTHSRYLDGIGRLQVKSLHHISFGNSMGCRLPGSSAHGIFPGKNPGVACHFLLQGIFPTQESNPGLQHWQAGSLLTGCPTRSHWGSLQGGSETLSWRHKAKQTEMSLRAPNHLSAQTGHPWPCARVA